MSARNVPRNFEDSVKALSNSTSLKDIIKGEAPTETLRFFYDKFAESTLNIEINVI